MGFEIVFVEIGVFSGVFWIENSKSLGSNKI
jgi:hypothetical protein